MSIGDHVSRILVEIKGDTSDIKAKLRDLQGEERKLADAQLKNIDAHNKGIESQIEMIGRMGLVVGTVSAAVVGAFKAMEAAGERQRLVTQAGQVNLERLSAAAGGAKTSLQLLSDAAKFQTGEFKLSQDQMVMVEKAIRQITRESGNMEEVTKKVTDSIVKLNGGALDDYGIHVRDAKTDSEKFAAVMDALGAKAGKLSDEQLTAAESTAKLKATFTDTADRTVEALGKLAAGMTPMLEALAASVSMIGDLVGLASNMANIKIPGSSSGVGKTISNITGKWLNPAYQAYWIGKKIINEGDAINEALAGGPREIQALDRLTGRSNVLVSDLGSVGSGEYLPGMRPDAERNIWDDSGGSINPLTIWENLKSKANPERLKEREAAAEKQFEQWDKDAEAAKKAAEKWAKTPAGRQAMLLAAVGPVGIARAGVEPGGSVLDEGLNKMLEVGNVMYGLSGDEYTNDMMAAGGAAMQRLDQEMKAREAELTAGRESQLEKIFGPIQEFDVYAKGFQLLTGAAQSAFSAWIDGSMSAGDAIKKFFAESLKGQAVDLAGRAILHGAYALGMLAFGDLPAAAMHGKAAAMSAAGAVALGGLAKALTPSGGGAPATAGAAAGGGGGRSLSQAGFIDVHQRGSAQVIVVGDPHAMDSPRTRAANMRKMARYAGLTGENGVALR